MKRRCVCLTEEEAHFFSVIKIRKPPELAVVVVASFVDRTLLILAQVSGICLKKRDFAHFRVQFKGFVTTVTN